MKFVGRRDQVRLYSNADSLRKQPQAGRKWQDSAWLNWWDVKNKVGGIHRIGHEYNWEQGPRVAAWTNLVTASGIYKHVVHLPLREEDKRATGWGGGDDVRRVDFDPDGHSLWTINDPSADVSASLRFEDFHEAFNGFPNSGRTAEDIAPSHIDVAGNITGTITVQGVAHRADGMGVRDHGWGFRDIGTMRSHRYVSATFGREFPSFPGPSTTPTTPSRSSAGSSKAIASSFRRTSTFSLMQKSTLARFAEGGSRTRCRTARCSNAR